MEVRAKHWLLLVLAICVSTVGLLFSQDSVYEMFAIELFVEPDMVCPGGTGVLLVRIFIPHGYSVSDGEGAFGIFPEAEKDTITFGEMEKPAHDYEGEEIGYWSGVKTYAIPFNAADGSNLGGVGIEVGIRIQACEEESGVCYFPQDFQKDIVITIGGKRPESGR